MNIDLVESLNHFLKLKDNVSESGSLRLDDSQAKKLVGGKIWFHEKTIRTLLFWGYDTWIQGSTGWRVSGKDCFPASTQPVLQKCQHGKVWMKQGYENHRA